MSETAGQVIGSQPLVSCIVIFFNAKKENYFEEAIESILTQTYPNWELILADDGSTDESTTVAKHYVQQYPEKVRYVEHEGHQNRGMSATRNLGIRHARGEYIAFLDADDVWLPHKLEQQISLIEKYPEAAMLYGRTQFWFSWAPHNEFRSLFSLKEDDADPMTMTSVEFDRLIQPPAQLLLYLRDRNIYPCSCSILIRRYVFEKIGGFEEDFRNANEDMVFHSKVFLKFPVYVSSECWDRYRIHPDSYWRTAWREGKGKEAEQTGRLKYLTWLEGYMLEQGIEDPVIWRGLRRALFPYHHPNLYRLLEIFQSLIQLLRRIYRKLKRGVIAISG